MTDQEILNEYLKGIREFRDIDVESGDLSGADLSDIYFEGCYLAIDFRRANLKGARFINGNIKTCDFRGADLTDAIFENLLVEGVEFCGAIGDGTVFRNNYCYSAMLQQSDFEDMVKE